MRIEWREWQATWWTKYVTTIATNIKYKMVSRKVFINSRINSCFLIIYIILIILWIRMGKSQFFIATAWKTENYDIIVHDSNVTNNIVCIQQWMH